MAHAHAAHPHEHTQLRPWVLPLSATVSLPFFACALTGTVGEPQMALVGAVVLAAASWKTQQEQAGVEAPAAGALIALLFSGTWLYDATREAWHAVLWSAPLPAVLAAVAMLSIQLSRGERDPLLVEGAAGVLFFAAIGLAGLGLLGL